MSESGMNKQALLIGINEYQILPELKFARQDAEAVEQSLKQNYSFSDNDIMLLTDAKPGLLKPTSKRIVLTHLEKLANQELDLFIFGFWGHGVVRNGQRFLCPLNAMPDAIEEDGVPFDDLMNLLTKIRAKNMCLILDCCQKVYDRGETETFTAEDQKTIENAARDIVLKRKEKEPEFITNVAILNSCKQGQSAYEWDKRKHGIFTAHLLDAFNRRFDSVSKIVGYISANVEKTAMELGKKQTPLCSMEGDIPLPVNTKSSPLITGEVFVSYRHCNADLVAPVETELKKRGISYFIDREGVNYGMDYSEAISQAILACKIMLLIWTPEVKGSNDIVSEVTMALQAKKIVMPYKIGTFNSFDHPRLCYHLSHLSRYEVPQQTQKTISEIVNRIVLALSGKSLPAPSTPIKFDLPTNSSEAVIEQPEIEDIVVNVSPAPIEQKSIEYNTIQLPPLPDELVNIQSENKGREIAIAQLKDFSHESLSQANAAVAQTQAQYDAWKERKESLWKGLSNDVRQTLEKTISNIPDCTEADVNIPTDNMSNQEYFDFIEQIECGKKFEQARLELERVQKQRQEKCEETINRIQQDIESENEKTKKIGIQFMDEVLLSILAVLPGYDEFDSSFPNDVIVAPLRLLDKYELGWRGPEELNRARKLWKEARPCVIERNKVLEEQRLAHDKADEYYNNAHELRTNGKFDEAFSEIDKALDLYPKDQKYEFEKSLIEKQQRQVAEDCYENALKLLGRGKYAEALSELDRSLGLYPDDSKYLTEKSLIDNQRRQTAEEHFSNVQKLRIQGEIDKALYEIDQAIGLYPDNQKYVTEKGLIEKQRRHTAEEHYKNALKLQEQKNFNNALREINQAINLYPNEQKYEEEKSLIVALFREQEIIERQEREKYSQEYLAREKVEKEKSINYCQWENFGIRHGGNIDTWQWIFIIFIVVPAIFLMVIIPLIIALVDMLQHIFI